MIDAFWSDEDDGFIAIDTNRPGCSAFGKTLKEAVKELKDAQIVWDVAHKAANDQG